MPFKYTVMTLPTAVASNTSPFLTAIPVTVLSPVQLFNGPSQRTIDI